MTLCRFEDRLAGQARVLSGLLSHITACSAVELPAAFAAIQTAQQAGHWIALLLDYELGEWFEPSLQPDQSGTRNDETKTHSRLTALVYANATIEAPWGAPTSSLRLTTTLLTRPRARRRAWTLPTRS